MGWRRALAGLVDHWRWLLYGGRVEGGVSVECDEGGPGLSSIEAPRAGGCTMKHEQRWGRQGLSLARGWFWAPSKQGVGGGSECV